MLKRAKQNIMQNHTRIATIKKKVKTVHMVLQYPLLNALGREWRPAGCLVALKTMKAT